VARWERPLFRFAYRLLDRRDDARDVCQETFLRILDKSDRFREGARFSTWMYQIALNLCRDHLRRKRRWSAIVRTENDSSYATADRLESIPGTADPSIDLESRERRAALTRAMEDIPPEQREVLILKEFEGLKFREIAVILGCPESTVKSRMYYGLTGLRSALVRQGIEGL
jgi:RNA polymerase sigma-70 factor (ECF subfamily)